MPVARAGQETWGECSLRVRFRLPACLDLSSGVFRLVNGVLPPDRSSDGRGRGDGYVVH